MKRQQKHLPNNILKFYLPVFTIAAVSLVFYFSKINLPHSNFNWEGINSEVRDTVKKIEAYDAVTDRMIGIAAKKSPQWKRQMWLKQNATLAELQNLKAYPNSAVKAIIFDGLLKRKKQDNYELMKEAFRDTTTFFDYQSGCIGMPFMLGEYLYEEVLYMGEYSPSLIFEEHFKRFGLSEIQLEELGEINKVVKSKKWDYQNAKYSKLLENEKDE